MGFEAVVLPGYQARLVEIQASVAHLRLGQFLAFAILCAAITAILLLGFLALTRRGVRLPYSLFPLPALLLGTRSRPEFSVCFYYSDSILCFRGAV